MQTTTEPKVWVACLASHNAGKLHGKWVDLDINTSESDLWAEIEEVLESSPEPGAEEWAIHDYSDFPDLGEHPSVEELARVAEAIERYGEAFKAALSIESDVELAVDLVQDRYRGHWESVKEYADSYLEDTGAYHDMGDFAAQYFDLDRYARDLEIELITVAGDGGVHIFDSH